MIVAVIDTNVLISGVLGYDRPDSAPGEILRRWSRGDFTLVLSPALLDELQDVLSRPYFVDRLSVEQRERALAAFLAHAEQTRITMAVQGVAPDPDDDHVLAAVVSSQAEYLVTGDQPLLGLATYDGVKILSPRAFLDVLLEEKERQQSS